MWTHVGKKFFFFSSIYPPSPFDVSGFPKMWWFQHTCVWCSFVNVAKTFFFFCPRQLRSFVFKLLCCSRSPCSPGSCVLPLLPPPDSEQQERTFVLPNNIGGQLKKLLCAINVSDSPPNLRHLQREAAACPRRLVPGLCAGGGAKNVSATTTTLAVEQSKKKSVNGRGEKTCLQVLLLCASVRAVCVRRILLPLKWKTDLLHSETFSGWHVLRADACSACFRSCWVQFRLGAREV